MVHTLSDSNFLQRNRDQVWWLAIMYLWHNSSCLAWEGNLPKWWVQSPSKRAHLKHINSWLRIDGECKLPRWGRLLKVMHHQYTHPCGKTDLPPCTSESCFIYVKFWFTQTTRIDVSRGIWNLLYYLLRSHEIVDLSSQWPIKAQSVPRPRKQYQNLVSTIRLGRSLYSLVNDSGDNECGITSPGV